jgi:2-polyprenyl-3-methyl-5-hydroxy-6-metoxy-1,4-benzoquinol methylase
MQRIVEPELMVEPEQAEAYAAADFAVPHQRVIDRFRDAFPDWSGHGYVLDAGCGPGDIAMRFARAYPSCHVDGIDGAVAMLEVGHRLLEHQPGIRDRVTLHRACLPAEGPPREQYHAVISNSLLHHLHDPSVLWNAVVRHAAPGAPVFVIDLMRPDTPEDADRLTALHVAGEPAVLRRDFHASLFAAFTVDEVRAQLDAVGLTHLAVAAISDRHLQVHGLTPESPHHA